MYFELSINQNIVNKGDAKRPGWVNTKFDANDLMKHILHGYAFSQGVLLPSVGNSKPSAADISHAQLLPVDIDNDVEVYDQETKTRSKRCKTMEEGYMSFDSVLEDPWFHENALLAYTTPSHTGLQNKFRIVFLLPEVIDNPNKYKEVASAFIDKFDSDKSCKNIDRMFFGHTNAEYCVFNNKLSINELNRILNINKGLDKVNKTFSRYINKYSDDKLTESHVADMLNYIPAYMAYDEWFRIVSGIGNYFDEDTATRLIENWSPDVKQGTRYKIQHRSPKATIASVIYYASQYGYNKSKLMSRLSVATSGKIVKNKLADDDVLVDEADDTSFEDSFDIDSFVEQSMFPKKLIFWYEKTKNKKVLEDVNEAADKANYTLLIRKEVLIKYLAHIGFRKYWVDHKTSVMVRVQNNIVEFSNEEKIIDSIVNTVYLFPFNVSEHFNKFDIVEMMLQKINDLSSPKFLRTLPELKDEFVCDSPENAFFFFSNTCIKATKNSYSKIDYKDLDGFVWKEQISDHKIDKVYIDFSDNPHGEDDCGQFETFIKKVCSPKTSPEQHRTERKVDQQRFNALVSAIGYMIHTYKDPTLTKAIILCEEKIAKGDDSNGRTGKGLTAKAISKLRKEFKFNGKKIDFSDKFFYQMVTPDTQVVYFDDVEKNFNFEKLFSDLTEGINVERKGLTPTPIVYAKSPKFLISTNSVLANDSDSHKARKFEIEYSDYFDANYQPPDEFGNRFFEEGWDIGSDEWDKFYSFMISCAIIFMNHGLMSYDSVNME